MILVTGATGAVGDAVARQLAARQHVRVLARRPERISVTGPRVETVAADYSEPSALRRALRGVRAAFLVTNHPTEPHDETFLEAAAAMDVAHVVKLSAAAVDDGLDDVVTCRQRAIEAAVRSAGVAWTLLRPRAFMSNTLAWAPEVRRTGTVCALYGDAANVPVDPRDVAHAAVQALTEPGHEGKTYTLAGPERLTARDQTRILAQVLARPLEFREWTPEEARGHLSRRFPPAVVEALLQRAALQAAGGKALHGDAPAGRAGRPATVYRTWAQDHAHHFSEGTRRAT
ncbi:NAD(P)H-binding protein [Streptomyces sp. NPDC016845]|uniref:NAD(P)H-binding protein n=1 Tax=Streptomyces sp. NPDC016845 TaxID=3364972 RepID=UPI00379BC742